MNSGSQGQTKQISFNLTKIKDLSEKSLFPREFKVKRILPLVEISGLLYITNQRLYFQPYHNIYDEQVVHFTVRKFTEFFKRRFKLMETGLQLMLKSKRSGYRTLYLAFQNEKDRNAVHDAISAYLPDQCKSDDIPIIEYTRECVKG